MYTSDKTIHQVIQAADMSITAFDYSIVTADNYHLVKFSKEYRKGTKLPVKVWPALRSLGGISRTRWGKIRSIKVPK